MPESAVRAPAPGEIALWRLCLDTAPSAGDLRVLAADERARAARFRRPVDARRWSAARAFLRRVLGAYLGLSAEQVHFEAGPDGKPAVAGHPDLYFNLSHSGSLVLVALTELGEVGVDVEQVRADVDCVELARVGLGPRAAAHLDGLAAEARVGEFFRLWARHEATVKCRGSGLGTATPDDPAREWLADVDVGAGYAAAVALAGDAARSATPWVAAYDAALLQRV